MEIQAEKSYNCDMSVKVTLPAIELKPFPKIDLYALCRQTREKLGISRAEMAELLGVTYAAYEHYEAERREPNSQVVAKLFLLREQLGQIFPSPALEEKQQPQQ